MAIRNVIFDFGNVLVDWDPAAALTGRYDGADIRWFLADDGAFAHGNRLTNEGVPIDEALDSVRDGYGELAAEMFDWYWDHAADAVKGNQTGMRQLLEDVNAAGLGTYGLSNWPADTFDEAYELFPIFHELDDMVVSGRVRLRKPDPAIFALAIGRFGIDPAETVYVDDLDRNVAAARATGLHGIRFDGDATRLRATLIGLGVGIPATLPRRS